VIRTIAELPFAAANAYGDQSAHRAKRDGAWVDTSFKELADTVRALARGLIAAGIAPGDRVALLAETKPEWTQAGLAVVAAGAILVPIYPSSSVEEVSWILADSGARMAICGDGTQLAKVTVLPVSTVDMSAGGLAALAADEGDAELDRRLAAIDPDDPSIIIYTSGTTGPPKGCVLTQRNWVALCEINAQLPYIVPGDVVYLFLPLAHVFAQITQFACLHAGATLAYFSGDVRAIVPELSEVRPTFLPSVPRIFEKVYTAVQEAPAVVVQGVFGGRLRMALSGAAPIAVGVLEFFAESGVPVLEGYAMTESTGVGTVNTLAEHRLGSVGRAAPGTRIRIAEDGEVLMSGPHIFAGYWRNFEATTATLVDGWLHTGDLGVLDEDGYLTITGRKKDIIITSGGKNIAPANLENDLRQSRWISYAVVYGDRRPYPVALLTLDPEEILPWARAHGLPADLTALADHPDVLALVGEVVDAVNARYARALQIKRFAILDRDLSQETGELTPTLKVKRAVVHRNHGTLFDTLYEESDGRG
jgi:long-chain acyl-CoA synthetase